MNFGSTEEQDLLRKTARDVLAARQSHVRQILDGDEAYAKASWKELAELGWRFPAAADFDADLAGRRALDPRALHRARGARQPLDPAKRPGSGTPPSSAAAPRTCWRSRRARPAAGQGGYSSNRGRRFSRKARRPSWASGDWLAFAIMSLA